MPQLTSELLENKHKKHNISEKYEPIPRHGPRIEWHDTLQEEHSLLTGPQIVFNGFL